jgi:hypothetical protein
MLVVELGLVFAFIVFRLLNLAVHQRSALTSVSRAYSCKVSKCCTMFGVFQCYLSSVSLYFNLSLSSLSLGTMSRPVADSDKDASQHISLVFT